MKISTFLLLFFGCFFTAQSQTTIKLKNPSFEDLAGPSRVPNGWYNSGAENESPSDIHPCSVFKVVNSKP